MLTSINVDILSLPIIGTRHRRNTTLRLYPIISGIYKITSPIGAIYVGLSHDIYHRIHNCYKKINCNQQFKIFNSLKKYGVENHKFEIIHIIEKGILNKSEITKELNNLEIYYINKLNSFSGQNPEFGMNLTKGGSFMQLTQESWDKINKSKIGRKQSEETKLKRSKSNKGQKPSPQTIKASINASKGKIVNEETKQKLRDINLGKKQSEETKIKKNNALKGKKRSDTTKKLMSKSKTGNKNPNFNKTTSLETREKISIGLKKYLESKKNN